jgi:hypothetical protein
MAKTATVEIVAHNRKTLGDGSSGLRKVLSTPIPNGDPAAAQVDDPVRVDRAASEEAVS